VRTLVLQLVLPALFLLFGGTALLIARERGRVPRDYRLSWLLTGATFTLYGLVIGIQNACAAWAYVAGPGSRALELYLRYAPLGNHSRTFGSYAYCLAMLGLAFSPRLRNTGRVWLLAGLVAAGMMVGAAYGWREGAFVRQVHYTAVAMMTALELILLLAMLFATLVVPTVDRLHWFAVGLHTFGVALNILWYVGLLGIGFGWAPAPWLMAAYRVMFAGAMAGLAVRRLILARKGVPVPGLIDSGEGAPVMATR